MVYIDGRVEFANYFKKGLCCVTRVHLAACTKLPSNISTMENTREDTSSYSGKGRGTFRASTPPTPQLCINVSLGPCDNSSSYLKKVLRIEQRFCYRSQA